MDTTPWWLLLIFGGIAWAGLGFRIRWERTHPEQDQPPAEDPYESTKESVGI
ncbi:MAG TPA: hypothetical protein VGM94_05150 [Galbitalea sp.]|jgi:hypothetical protein